MAEIQIEEKRRGAPWMLIMILLGVALVIGWWLWSNRTVGEPTTSGPSGGVVSDTARPVTP